MALIMQQKFKKKIEDGDRKLKEVKYEQNIFKSYLNEIKKRMFKLEDQKSAMQNIEMLYKIQNKVIKLFDDYTTVASEAKSKTAHGEGIKIFVSKEMFQTLPNSTCPSKSNLPNLAI